jgi:hypothetical protein
MGSIQLSNFLYKGTKKVKSITILVPREVMQPNIFLNKYAELMTNF